jgi:Icc protein
MSDLHLTSDKHPIWGVDTYKQFAKALEKIGSIPNIDCIVVSGDIADDGNYQTYQYADDMLNSLSIPVLWCPGNHDNIKTFYEYANESKSTIGTPLSINGVRLLPLNTVTPDEDHPNLNRSRGVLFDEDFQYLDKQFVDQQCPTILVMHHPSIDPGGWMTNKILDNRDLFNDSIRKYDSLFLILYGHIHFHMIHKQDDKTFISAPSIGFAFHKDLAKYEINKGQEGFLIIDVEDNNMNVQIVNIE